MPIVNPSAAGGRAPPKSPAVLYQQLAAAMSGAVAEVRAFQGLWRSADMRAMWERVGAQIDANDGQLLQPTGVWDRDYEALRAELAALETAKMERERRAEEEAERARIQAAEGGWRGVVEGFVARNGGLVRVLPSKAEDEMTVVLGKAGMRFRVYADGAGATVEGGVPEWRVSARPGPGQPVSRAEAAVVECLNARGRQWDLVHLLVGLRGSTCSGLGVVVANNALGYDLCLLRHQANALREMQQNDRQRRQPPYHPSPDPPTG